ncbi:hypothetical protein [Actinospica sp.]|uniref:hypothetical protein n=1 Tax=Actinospica sp. TaxID=1872142 RepID=UPI002B9D8E45|nr:hypothetical protein [Actinospica sp.]HWG27978.1 hypothetical protein [Actinospica sp.]
MPENDPNETTQLLPLARAADPQTAPIPVFADSTSRRRVVRRTAVGAFLAAVGYSLMVVWGLLGGPVSPSTLTPFSAPHAAPAAQPKTPSAGTVTVPPAPSTSSVSGGTSSAATHSASPSAAPSTPASTFASPSPSVSATGHRQGKPGKTASPGHG